jgi:ABC-type multidrug transport system ATPase subunit
MSEALTSSSVEALRSVPIFSVCSPAELKAIAAALEEVSLPAGAVIFKEGDPGEDMYVIASGQVRVVSDAETEKVILAHFGPGEPIGEMALMTGAPRSAAVIATTDVRLWRLRKQEFDRILAEFPSVSIEISRVLGQRVSRGNVNRYQNEAFNLLSLTSERTELTIGRWPENDLVIADPHIDGLHARIRRVDGGWRIIDEGSAGGTFVNRVRVKEADLKDGDEIWIGTHKVFLDGLHVKTFVGREGIRIDAEGLTKVVGGNKVILDEISLSVQPGEFVALVGGSGAGKTSLLHALSGFAPATAGAVYYDGVNLYENSDLFRPLLGYLPQDDIIHPELTVGRTVYYAARLRLPRDTRPEEIEQRVEEVLEGVGLREHRNTVVRRLSGGQRKRVSLAVELLARPKAFFLDEPTSGLDPALEGRMMSLFHDLTLNGATVILSTHVTQNLGMCDKVAWLGRGGRLVFFGSPPEVLRHFGVRHFGEVYDLLEAEGGVDQWAGRFRESPVYVTNVTERLAVGEQERKETPAAGRGAERASRQAGPLRQLYWLTVRYAEVIWRDPRYLALLLAQAPAIALAVLLLFSPAIFAATVAAGGDALRAMASLKVMMLSAIWLGAFNAARAISGESAIYARERLVNLGVIPYVLSKVGVLAVLCVVQSVLLLAILALRIDLWGLGRGVYLELQATIILTSLAGLTLGLLASAAVSNTDQAMALVPILLIPQLIFDGAFVPVEHMVGPAKAVAHVVISKWSLELGGHSTGLAEAFHEQLPEGFGGPFARAFEIDAWVHWLVLGAFVVAPLLGVLLVQKRKDQK